ncbi:class I SAM-dependent RNA methyltransferase [Pelagerythrobacter marinus]|uniref:class I SAM-dependent RNA methyltransferase n=1 Tax=Pelagerythrobacter marinus TaxID=538382 RepID=UPI00203693FA|nr:class I SAM-dependent RNA methyltransferase [Pelagerythrobacter marinus]USA38337.1 class I SAM-dependent RNA methyltransferase [Pelagerythrobacter marinus]WPZ07700.1 class I SAM-dependent RNA methyltransferase [Pelagerythrobacter marinus]
MNETDEILRIAAKGDGVTADGRHVPLAAPGDRVGPDGAIARGPHHAEPPCRHFGTCGGCQLQHCDAESIARYLGERVTYAAQGQGVAVGRLLAPHLSPPASRRRCALHAETRRGPPAVGFREAGSHRVVDMRECHILRPELFALVPAVRELVARRKGRQAAKAELALVDQGVDCAISGLAMEGLEQTEAMLAFARDNGLARLTIDQGYGPEPVWEPEPLTVTLSGVPVDYPSGAFLQATADGEAALTRIAAEWLAGSRFVADLFAGLGTFAFALSPASKVLAVEAARDAHLACKAAAGRAGRPVHAMHRDLFRNPLQPDELDRFDAVLLDPPRAGAREQVARLADSSVPRIVYVSCNPASWARDAARLVAAGYRIEAARPVGQFVWSTHVELASLFVREPA